MGTLTRQLVVNVTYGISVGDRALIYRRAMPGFVGRVRDSGADEVVTTLADAVMKLVKLAPPPAELIIATTIPAKG